MSDTSSDSETTQPRLIGQSRLLIIVGKTDRMKLVIKSLRARGAERVTKGVYIIPRGSLEFARTDYSLYLEFTKSKEIIRLRDVDSKRPLDRSYAIVVYSIRNPTPKQKKKVERLARKSTGIRLRPGVLLFIHFRSREKQKLFRLKENQSLLDSLELNRELVQLGAHTSRFTRLRLSTNCDYQLIESAGKRMFSEDIDSLEQRIQLLRLAVRESSLPSQTIRRRYSILKSRFREVKLKWEVIGRIWGLETRKPLSRVYNLLLGLKNSLGLSS